MRLDVFLCERGDFDSRTKAAEAIAKGQVLLGGKRAKAGAEVRDESEVQVLPARRYVSNGGYKLERAAQVFGYDPRGKVFADIGASTGGFTDFLLQNGAKKVFAVDVGENLLHPSLRGDERVAIMDKTNARDLKREDFPPLDGIAADCSFISLELVLPAIRGLCSPDTDVFALVKPQFECGEKRRFKNGIVREKSVREAVVKKLYAFCKAQGFFVADFTNAPVVPGKNVEYMMRLKIGKGGLSEEEVLSRLV